VSGARTRLPLDTVLHFSTVLCRETIIWQPDRSYRIHNIAKLFLYARIAEYLITILRFKLPVTNKAFSHNSST
jgi:hypothetical protein